VFSSIPTKTGGVKQGLSAGPARPMSEAERIMKEELKRKRLWGGAVNAGNKQRIA